MQLCKITFIELHYQTLMLPFIVGAIVENKSSWLPIKYMKLIYYSTSHVSLIFTWRWKHLAGRCCYLFNACSVTLKSSVTLEFWSGADYPVLFAILSWGRCVLGFLWFCFVFLDSLSYEFYIIHYLIMIYFIANDTVWCVEKLYV